MPGRTRTRRHAEDNAGPLTDHLRRGLDVVFVGINPGLESARQRHHYAGPTNHFWPLLFESGLVPERLTFADDARCPRFGFGLTNLVGRPSRGIDDLSRQEMDAGAAVVRDKLRRYRPRVVCFNGRKIYEVFSGDRKASLGLQPERYEGALVYVMPSTSARAASYQRADKLRYFRELKRIVDKEKAL